MNAYKATVKKSKNARNNQEWIYFSKNIEAATDYAERMTDETFYGAGVVIKVEETKDPRG